MENSIKLTFILSLLTLMLYRYEIVNAQEKASPILWQIETKDGNVYYGKIISQSQEILRLETENLGILTIPVENIRSIRELSENEVKDGEIWPENAQATRYFFAPNGYGLRKGEGYYQNVWIFFNQLSFGVSDNFSVGLGMVPLFLFAGAPTPIWITPKLSVPVKKDKLNLGVGALVGTVIGEGSTGFGMAYGVLTVGDRNKNLNIGLGYGFADGGWADTPLINIGGMLRLSPKGYLLTENYFVVVDGSAFGAFSIGGRTVWNRFSLDYGGFVPFNDVDGLIIVPWLGFVVPLGK
ncbi:hypothetical protein OKW21_002246 [Catalinimonas alkaloidigena]|uniref:hypothetical protein n=1 Tax=Catalinimonas alkaloidigena TaxID=1075417 RepID=UPI0024065140|nr:hypothetical protein [Catalinimonas alkaloidigena]MDF9796983.1 hypothetical protein [Catalinimonas alkaloidigena]